MVGDDGLLGTKFSSEAAYQQAEDLVESMREHYNNDAFVAAYGLKRGDIDLDHAGHYDG